MSIALCPNSISIVSPLYCLVFECCPILLHLVGQLLLCNGSKKCYIPPLGRQVCFLTICNRISGVTSYPGDLHYIKNSVFQWIDDHLIGDCPHYCTCIQTKIKGLTKALTGPDSEVWWPQMPTPYRVNLQTALHSRACWCEVKIPNQYGGVILWCLFSCPGQLNKWHCLSVGLSEPTNNQSLGSIKEWP